MVGTSPQQVFGVSNIAIPPKGPKAVPIDIDFSVQTSIDISGELATAQGHIDYVQGFYYDNGNNADPITFTVQGTNQVIKVPGYSQGYVPALFLDPPFMTVATTAAADKRVRITLYNVPIQAQIWYTDGAGGQALTDAQLRASPVEVTPTQPIGAAYTNRSIANLSGASEQLMPANANRRVLIVSNEGATAVAVNIVGGAAALNTAGSITIAAGGNIVLDTYPPTGVINIIGTLNADVTAFEA
jgi:hypothetical protein